MTKSHLTPEMECRLKAVLRCPENKSCADCDEAWPRWVSFLTPHVKVDRQLGVLVCCKCAQHHHFELGEKRCMIKFLDMTHEWMEEDTEVLEYSGNAFVNSIFEAKLEESNFDKHAVFSDEEEEATHRARFIKYKYKKRKFQDEVVYYKRMLELLLGKRDSDWGEEEEERSTSSLASSKRRSYRRIRSVPQWSRSSSSEANAAQETGSRMSRSASSPNMKQLVGHEEVDNSHKRVPAVLRRKSTKSAVMHKRHGRAGGALSPMRKSLTIVESRKIDMRNRRLSAIAGMTLCVELPPPDNKRQQSFSHAA